MRDHGGIGQPGMVVARRPLRAVLQDLPAKDDHNDILTDMSSLLRPQPRLGSNDLCRKSHPFTECSGHRDSLPYL